MEFLSPVLMLAAAVFGIFLLIKVLSAPIKLIFKLLINAVLGFVLLWLVNFFGAFVDIQITVNLINCLIVGFLGVPGILLLIVLGFLL